MTIKHRAFMFGLVGIRQDNHKKKDLNACRQASVIPATFFTNQLIKREVPYEKLISHTHKGFSIISPYYFDGDLIEILF